jgi:hypothetical protein
VTFRIRLFVISLLVLFVAMFAFANDIYIAQNSAGGNTGADCADARSVSWFNSSSNWGSGAAQIGPGTNVHLCSGTYTGGGGASDYLTFQRSGTSGKPITLIADQGPVTITSTSWSGPVINLAGKSYVTVNGTSSKDTANGTSANNLTIEATLNGTSAGKCSGGSCTSQTDGGICVNNGSPNGNSSNVTITNVTCQNLYVISSPADNGGENTSCFDIWNVDNGVVQNNVCTYAKWIRFSYAVGSTYANPVLTYSGNNLSNMDHPLFITASDTSGVAVASGFYIYGNTYGSMAAWDNNADNNHHDWIAHISANGSASSLTDFYIYNNTAAGDVGANANAAIFTANDGGGILSNINVFNNLAVNTSTNHCFANGFITWSNGGSMRAVNNTFVSHTPYNGCTNNGENVPGDDAVVYEGGSTGLTFENNIVQGMAHNAIYTDGSGTSVTAINYNDDYNVGGWDWMGEETTTFSTWQSDCRCDGNSITKNPSLSSSTYVPTSGSPVISAGLDLNATCSGQPTIGLGALCSDANGNARPSSGGWTMGAFQAGLTANVPNPPSDLQATVSP